MTPPPPFPVSFNFSLDMFNGINSLLFQQSLQDLVKGIRAHRRDEDDFIRSKLTEITEECRSADITKKTNAILKLTHVRLLPTRLVFSLFSNTQHTTHSFYFYFLSPTPDTLVLSLPPSSSCK